MTHFVTFWRTHFRLITQCIVGANNWTWQANVCVCAMEGSAIEFKALGELLPASLHMKYVVRSSHCILKLRANNRLDHRGRGVLVHYRFMHEFSSRHFDLTKFVLTKSGLFTECQCRKSSLIRKKGKGHQNRALSQKNTQHANREIWPTNSLTKVLTKMPTRVSTKMPTEMPTKVEAFSVQNAPEDPHEDSHESAHGKFSSAHENVHESGLGQFSHVLFSHVLFLAHLAS